MFVGAIALAVVILDQLTKALASSLLPLHYSTVVIPGFFSLTYLRNTGAAWGMFSGNNLLLIGVSLGMLILLACYRRHFLTGRPVHRLALALLVGGIIGNTIDRFAWGWVIDFLDFHIASYHWPTFNIADSAICVAIGLYLFSQWVGVKDASRTNRQ